MRRCNGQECNKKEECQRYKDSKSKKKQFGTWINSHNCVYGDNKDFIALGEEDESE